LKQGTAAIVMRVNRCDISREAVKECSHSFPSFVEEAQAVSMIAWN
jgi:hypothetical protein